MRKLEDIPKKSVFKVPEGYFEQLPTRVQARLVERSRMASSRVATFSFKFALPVIALVVAGIFWLRPGSSIEDQLDDIDAEQIALYLESSELSDLDDTHDPSDWTQLELDQLEDAVHSNMDYPNEDLLEEIDLENL